jgi:hypothetical protein
MNIPRRLTAEAKKKPQKTYEDIVKLTVGNPENRRLASFAEAKKKPQTPYEEIGPLTVGNPGTSPPCFVC